MYLQLVDPQQLVAWQEEQQARKKRQHNVRHLALADGDDWGLAELETKPKRRRVLAQNKTSRRLKPAKDPQAVIIDDTQACLGDGAAAGAAAEGHDSENPEVVPADDVKDFSEEVGHVSDDGESSKSHDSLLQTLAELADCMPEA